MPEEKPPLRMPQETIDRMKEMGPKIEEQRSNLAALRRVGIDTTQLEEQLNWAEEVKNTLLLQSGESEEQE